MATRIHKKRKTRTGPYDRIQPPCHYPCPDTPEEFLAMIQAHHRGHPRQGLRARKAPTCCSKCRKSTIQSTETINNLGRTTRVRTGLHFRKHQALQLSKMVEFDLAEDPEAATNEQLEATDEFQKLLKDQSDDALLKRLGAKDGRRIAPREMKKLCRLFLTILFKIRQEDQIPIDFRWVVWKTSPTRQGQCYIRNRHDPVAAIKMSPRSKFDDYEHATLSSRALDRLSTLLHELVHAFLDTYACQTCRSWEEEVGQMEGHGRAWLQVTKSVERAAKQRLGLPLVLGLFEAIECHWEEMKFWPLDNEVESWELGPR